MSRGWGFLNIDPRKEDPDRRNPAPKWDGLKVIPFIRDTLPKLNMKPKNGGMGDSELGSKHHF